MSDVLQKKINLLVHLANADGQFHASEKKILQQILSEHGAKDYELRSFEGSAQALQDASSIIEKEELLYWAFQLVKADGYITPDEISFCKILAVKLNFLPSIVDMYATHELPPLGSFIQVAAKFKLKGKL